MSQYASREKETLFLKGSNVVFHYECDTTFSLISGELMLRLADHPKSCVGGKTDIKTQVFQFLQYNCCP